MDAEKIVKSSQEQAVAAWIGYLNQLRIGRLVEALVLQKRNHDDALDLLDYAFAKIKSEIIERNRGGDKGMHGFIAEIAECGIGNARERIRGNVKIYDWVNDNSEVDLRRGTINIQQKFVQSGGHLSLRAVAEHLKIYPDFLKNGGKYQIPKDHYDKIMEYFAISESEANKLPTSTGDFSLRQWQEIRAFFKNGDISLNDLEPSFLDYADVQRDNIATTFAEEKEMLKAADRTIRDKIYSANKVTLVDGAKNAAASGVIEGLTTFCTAVARKRKAGIRIKDFTEADWIDVAGESGKGVLKGGIRGASIYVLINATTFIVETEQSIDAYTLTPAAVANAVVTAAFGVAEQAHQFRSAAITEIQFIENAELLCLDSAVSALASIAGQVMIPVPVIGSVIGNAVGTMLYQIGKDSLSAKEQAIIAGYLQELEEMDQQLDEEYQQFIERLNKTYADYLELLEQAFAPDVETALKGSAQLAKRMGVPAEEILDSYDKVASFFLG